MRYCIALILSCLSGCVTTNRVASLEDQYRMINESGREHSAEITIEVGTVTSVYTGDFVTVRRDSVQWLDPGTQQIRSAATSELRRIRFLERLAGAAKGAGIGALPFVLPTAWIVGNHIFSPTELSDDYALIGVGVLSGCAIIGGVVGFIVGDNTDYTFEHP